MRSEYLEVKGSWLHRLFVFRHLLEADLDQAFVSAAWPEAKRIVFYNEVDAGLGDVAFMTKLLTLIAAEPGAPELVLVTTSVEKQGRFELPGGVVVLPVVDACGHPSVLDCDLVVSAPGIFDHCRDGTAVLKLLGLPVSTPFLYIAEYGSIRQLRDDAFRGCVAGIESARDRWIDEVAALSEVDPDAVGFRQGSGEIVSQGVGGSVVAIGHLNRFFFDVAQKDNPVAAWMAQPSLHARSCGLEPGEIGVHIDPAMVVAAECIKADSVARRMLAVEIENPAVRSHVIEALESGEPVYQGYAHSGHRVFHDIVSSIEAGRERGVLLVIPDARHAERILSEDFPNEIKARLASRGFGGVDVLSRADEHSVSETASDTWGSGPRYRLVTIYPLSHRDMKTLMLIAEPPTMVSGDQSFSDAVSAFKALAVIEPVYCQTWHLDAVCALAEIIDPRVAAILRAGLGFEWSPESIDVVLPAVREPAVWSAFIALSKRIVEMHNTNGLVVCVIKRALWSADAARGAELRTWLEVEVARGLNRLSMSDGLAFSFHGVVSAVQLPVSIPRRSIVGPTAVVVNRLKT